MDCPMRPEPCPHCKNDVPVQQMKVSTKCEDLAVSILATAIKHNKSA